MDSAAACWACLQLCRFIESHKTHDPDSRSSTDEAVRWQWWMRVDRQGPHFRGQCTWLKAQCVVVMSFFSLWFCCFKGFFKLEIWLWRETLTRWVSISQAMHFVVWNAELTKQNKKVPVESRVMSLSLLDTALWKARRYIQFDLRFGSVDNRPGTFS